MSSDSSRQWRIVALAVVSASGRPLFLKNFPVKNATSTAGAFDFGNLEGSSAISTPSASSLDMFASDAKKYLAPWALKLHGESNETQQQQQGGGGGSNNSDDDNNSSSAGAVSSPGPTKQEPAKPGKLSLQSALSTALDFEEYTETETAQLFLYAALDRLDARRATEERRTGNPFESRGYAVFDRETRTKMRAFVLVRYWGRSLPSDCHHPCQTVLAQLIQKATVAYCDPFRDVALDEPLSEHLVMDQFLTSILKASTELPPTGPR